MGRDIRIFWLAIVLPALLIALGGMRLLVIESEHMIEADRTGLETAAAHAALDVRMYLRNEIDPLMDSVTTKGTLKGLMRAAALLERTNPWITQAHVMESRAESDRRFGPWVRGMGRDHGRGRLCLPAIRTFTVVKDRPLVVELDPLYILSRLPRVLCESGADKPSDKSRFATIAEIRDRNDSLLLPSSSAPRKDSIYGEATLSPVFPDWKVRVYRRNGAAAFDMARWTLFLIGCVLLLLLIAVLCVGGVLLTRAARKAKREALAKTDFISNMSHEFKTPLTTISLCADLAKEDELDADERMRAASSIQREATRLQRLLQRMLDFGRLESGRRVYASEVFDMAALARETAALMSTSSGLAIKVSDGECNVFAERDAVSQILVNLFDNVVKYAKGPVEVSFCLGRRAGWRAVHLADRGPGLTASECRHVFDRFWRADSSNTCAQGGSGLGLSIARGLARGMGGDLTVAPREGGGCVFTLELPACPPKKGEAHG